ncbi:MAG TPA: ribose-phosphate pyrophosphokinase [Candidatus Binatia bacterium]|nr:ribose-phosphate pyrophosphokinase [Candidatus Binatia bacterium]
MIENSTQTDGAKDAIKIFAGNSNPALARDICTCLGVPVARADIRRFSDGEINVDIQENVRGGDVFVIQSTSTPGNDHLMELLLMLDALKRASAGRITAVIPYYGYARQDRKVAPRVPISAKLVADLIETAGASRVLTMDLHAGQIQGFFNIPVDNLYATPVLLRYLRERIGREPTTVISPDAGGVERARAFAKRLDGALAVIDKRRSGANEVAEMHIIGEVRSRIAILVDDMVDTAGTICSAAQAALDAGAQEVVAACTHAVLSGPAIDRLEKSAITELIATDTIAQNARAAGCRKVKVLSVATLIAEAIRRTHQEESISSLFV